MSLFDDYKTFILIPEDTFRDLLQAIQDLRKIRISPEKDINLGVLGNYIDQDQAMKILKRGETWFWNKRKSGELTGKKAAGRWYYKIIDLQKYIENGRSFRGTETLS